MSVVRVGACAVAFLFAAAPLFIAANAQTAESQLIRNAEIDSQWVRDSDIANSSVRDSDLYGVHIRGATIDRTRLENAAITNATIRESTVIRASLHQVTVEGSELTGVHLEQARVTGGRLTDASVRATTLTDVVLCNVLRIENARIDNSGCGTPTPAPGTPTNATTPTPVPPTTPGTATGGPTVFPSDARTLARFEFNGDTRDASGNGRDLSTVGTPPSFASMRVGQGLVIGPEGPGLFWTPYASLMTHPFTVEMVFTPDETSSYRKLFSFDDARDGGWYIRGTGIVAYSAGSIVGGGTMTPGVEHYVAFVSTSPTEMNVYVDGAFVGATPMSFTAPPTDAVFMRDDGGGGEQFTGTLDALQITAATKSGADIRGVWDALGT